MRTSREWEDLLKAFRTVHSDFINGADTRYADRSVRSSSW